MSFASANLASVNAKLCLEKLPNPLPFRPEFQYHSLRGPSPDSASPSSFQVFILNKRADEGIFVYVYWVFWKLPESIGLAPSSRIWYAADGHVWRMNRGMEGWKIQSNG